MFSILNEISNNSHFTTTSVVVTSVGVSYMIYVLVAVTGYITFGNDIAGNIIAMCTPILQRDIQAPVIYAYECQQIHHHSVLPLERPPLLFLLCSPTRSKSILVEHPLMPCSNGGQPRIQIRPDHRDQGIACSCSLENLVARPEGTEWATLNLPLSLPPYSS